MDILQTLRECVSVYGGAALAPFLTTLFDTLHELVCVSGDVELVDTVLDVVHAVVAVVLPDLPSGYVLAHASELWDNFMGRLMVACLEELRVPDAKLARTHGRLLVAAAKASATAQARVLQRLWPMLSEMCMSSRTPPSQAEALLEQLAALLAARRGFPVDPALKAMAGQLVALFVRNLSSTHLLLLVFDTLPQLALTVVRNGANAQADAKAALADPADAQDRGEERLLSEAQCEALVALCARFVFRYEQVAYTDKPCGVFDIFLRAPRARKLFITENCVRTIFLCILSLLVFRNT